MPLTFAHPLAVVPLRRLGLPLSVLAVGSMIPDVVLFAPWLPVTYEQTHSPVGLISIDIVLGVVAWIVWQVLLRQPLIDAAPARVRARLPMPVTEQPTWWVVVASVLVGAVTHVFWDSFTHPGRWGTRVVPWLSQTHQGLLGAKWAQYASGIVGVLALVVLALLALHRALPRPVRRRRPRLAPWVFIAPALAAIVTAGLVAAQDGLTLHDLAFNVVTRAGTAAGLTLLVMAAAWHLAPTHD